MKVLILTDHTGHTIENSLYELSRELFAHEAVEKVDVASRKTRSNSPFFSAKDVKQIYTTSVDNSFCYSETNNPLENNITQHSISEYDFVWLRLPPPLTKEFLEYLERSFVGRVIINNPKATYETGSKAFLMNFKEVCPPMQICENINDILDFNLKFPIVLKPFRQYGGRGIWKIDGDHVSNGKEQYSLQEFMDNYKDAPERYLAVKYLENVKEGDKRIIVIDGEIMGATLRVPAENSWICNVSMGGTSHLTEVTPEEIGIVNAINPLLSAKGIVMYGVDTLMADNNKRLLSEINTTSIGGLPQAGQLSQKPLVKKGIELIMKNVLNRLQ